MPLAPTLELLSLDGNKLGSTITDEIAMFTKLTALHLSSMDLEGAFVLNQFYTIKKPITELSSHVPFASRRDPA